MDFVERIFGWSPDGGDGSLEMGLLVILPVMVMAVMMALRL